MRVVKPGPDPKQWKHECTCSGCNAVLDIELADIRRRPAQDDGPMHSASYLFVRCCECQAFIVLAEDQVPREHRHLIPEARA